MFCNSNHLFLNKSFFVQITQGAHPQHCIHFNLPANQARRVRLFLLGCYVPVLKQSHFRLCICKEKNKFFPEEKESIIYSILLPMSDNQNGDQILPLAARQTQPFIFSSEMDLLYQGKLLKQVKASLYDKFILLQSVIQNTSLSFKIQLSDDLKFELGFSVNSKHRKQSSCKKYNSLKFIGNNVIEFINFKEEGDLHLWRRHLLNRISQTNFHQVFKPVRELGRGSFATVYEAFSDLDNRMYAIKAFNKKTIEQKEFGQKGLHNEIQVMRELDHENLMKLHGVYQSKNSIYLCVQLLTGGDLLARMKENGNFSLEEAKTIMKCILSGLIEMHARNIMHRDLKPENILFRSAGSSECVIADFGLSEHINKDAFLFTKCGTPGYEAPQILNMRDNVVRYTHACDMFSLGVIFHFLLLGISPFSGTSMEEIIWKNKRCIIDFFDSIYRQLEPTALKLLKSLLEREPQRRLTAMEAMNHQFFKEEAGLTELGQAIEPLEMLEPIHRVPVPIDVFRQASHRDFFEPEGLVRNVKRKRKSARIQQQTSFKEKMNQLILARLEMDKQTVFCKSFGPRMNGPFKKIECLNQ